MMQKLLQKAAYWSMLKFIEDSQAMRIEYASNLEKRLGKELSDTEVDDLIIDFAILTNAISKWKPDFIPSPDRVTLDTYLEENRDVIDEYGRVEAEFRKNYHETPFLQNVGPIFKTIGAAVGYKRSMRPKRKQTCQVLIEKASVKY